VVNRVAISVDTAAIEVVLVICLLLQIKLAPAYAVGDS
jgi:hypothetical protein